MDDFVRKGDLFSLYGGLLKGRQREAYEYHIIEDMSFAEVGEALGISRQAAQELFSRAYRKLSEIDDILGLCGKMRSVKQLAERILEESGEEQVRKMASELLELV